MYENKAWGDDEEMIEVSESQYFVKRGKRYKQVDEKKFKKVQRERTCFYCGRVVTANTAELVDEPESETYQALRCKEGFGCRK